MAYEAQQNDAAVRRMAAANPNDVQLSPEVKRLIAEEVQQQLAAEKAASVRTPTAGPAHDGFVRNKPVIASAP